MGAALSYYSLFSIAPLLLIVIGIAGLVFGHDAARQAILDQLSGLMGDQTAQAVGSMLDAANRPKAGLISTIVGMHALPVLREVQRVRVEHGSRQTARYCGQRGEGA